MIETNDGFLIKKHNNNKTAGYNDIAYIVY